MLGMVGIPSGEQLVQIGTRACAEQLFTQLFAGEQLCQFREYLQVQVGCLFRHQQDKQALYRLAIRRIERNRVLQANEHACRFLEPSGTAMRNGHPLAKAGGAQFFPGKQAVENFTAGDAVGVFDKEAHLLEDALLAGDIQVRDDVILCQDFANQAHRNGCTRLQKLANSTLPSSK